MTEYTRQGLVDWFEEDQRRRYEQLPVLDANGIPWIVNVGAVDLVDGEVLSLQFTGVNTNRWFYPQSRFHPPGEPDTSYNPEPYRLLVPEPDPPKRWLSQEEFDEEQRASLYERFGTRRGVVTDGTPGAAARARGEEPR